MNGDSPPRLINAEDLIGYHGATTYQNYTYGASNTAVHRFRDATFPYASGLGRPSRRRQGLAMRQSTIMEKHREASLALRKAEELQEQAALAENSREQTEGLILTLESLTAKGERAKAQNRMERFARVNRAKIVVSSALRGGEGDRDEILCEAIAELNSSTEVEEEVMTDLGDSSWDEVPEPVIAMSESDQ